MTLNDRIGLPIPNRARFALSDSSVSSALNFSEIFAMVMVAHEPTALTEWCQRMAARAACAFVPETLKGRP